MMRPVAPLTKEVNPRLAKRQLKTNGSLANLELTSIVKEAKVLMLQWINAFSKLFRRVLHNIHLSRENLWCTGQRRYIITNSM